MYFPLRSGEKIEALYEWPTLSSLPYGFCVRLARLSLSLSLSQSLKLTHTHSLFSYPTCHLWGGELHLSPEGLVSHRSPGSHINCLAPMFCHYYIHRDFLNDRQQIHAKLNACSFPDRKSFLSKSFVKFNNVPVDWRSFLSWDALNLSFKPKLLPSLNKDDV